MPSVVGHEEFFMAKLAGDYKAMGLHATVYPGVLAVYGRDPFSAILCAHIDRHGLISLGRREYVYAAQYIREIKYGEPNRLAEKELQNIARRFAGEIVYAYDPVGGGKLGEGVIETCEPCMMQGDALFHILGMEEMDQNIPVAYARTARFEDGYLKGQIDNALSLGVIHTLFQDGFQGTALFSIEEEIGKSWLHISRYLEACHISTDSLLVLDTSPYTDNQAIETGHVVLRNRDMSETFNAALVDRLKQRCMDLGLPYQVKDEYLLAQGKSVEQLGSTELGRLIKWTERAWSGATVQVPTLMYHTSNETTTSAAIDHYYQLLHDILIAHPLAMLNAKVSDVETVR